MKKVVLETTYYVEMPSLEITQAKFKLSVVKESKVPIQEAIDLQAEIEKAAKEKGYEFESTSTTFVSDGVVYKL